MKAENAPVFHLNRHKLNEVNLYGSYDLWALESHYKLPRIRKETEGSMIIIDAPRYSV